MDCGIGESECQKHLKAEKTDPHIPESLYVPCTPSGNQECVSDMTDPIRAIAHTVDGEGGAGSPVTGANILQTIINRAYNYWTQHHAGINPDKIPWEYIPSAQLIDLIVFILSEPYTGSAGGVHPAYNAWEQPYPHSRYFDNIYDGVEGLVNMPGIHPSKSPISVGIYTPVSQIKNNLNVMYFVSTSNPNWIPPLTPEHIDWLPGGRIQYYFTRPVKAP